MELLQLRYFLESANTESFTETAKKYMVPQSSVSITVRRLEQELDCQLFDRRANKLVLNANGRKLQRSLVNILGELDQITAELQKAPKTVEIHILVKGMRSEIVREIVKYQQQNPDVQFISSFNYADTKYEDYDLIVTAEPAHGENFGCFLLCKRKLYMRAAADSPLCGRILTMESLRDQPFLITDKSSPLYHVLQKACMRAGFTPKIAMEINDAQHFNSCIRSGVGIGLTRTTNTTNLTGNEGTAILNVSDFNEWITYYICYRKPVQHLQILRFIELLNCLDL